MRDDDSALGDFRRDVWQAPCDVFIGKPAVKSVAPDPLLAQTAGNGVVVSDLVMVAMKCGVETAI